MSAKRLIIIGTTGILTLLLIIGGAKLYNRLSYNKQAHATDVYQYIPPDAGHLVRINNSQGLQNVCRYDSTFAYLATPLRKYINYPLFVISFGNGQLLMSKVSPEHETEMENIIGSVITTPPYVKKEKYKDAELLFYAMTDNQFIVCTFYKGVFAISKNYKLIEKVIDMKGNTFFQDRAIEELQIDMKHKYPSDIFVKSDSLNSIMGLNLVNDTLIFEGYLKFDDDININIYKDILNIDTLHYSIAEIDTPHSEDNIFIRVSLNKKEETAFNY